MSALAPGDLAFVGAMRIVRGGWVLLAAVGLLFFVAHVGTGLGGHGLDHFTSTWIYDGLELLAFAAVAARALLVGAERRVWALLAVGVGSSMLGDLTWNLAYGGNPPFPSPADGFYLAFYPTTYLALAFLVHRRLSRFNASVWLDGLTTSLAVASAGAAVLLEVVLRARHGRLVAEATNLAYPLGDIVLVAFVVGVFAVSGWRPGREWAAIGGALVLSSVADGIYLYKSAVGSYVAGTLLDALWPSALLLLALAAWLPPRRRPRLKLEGRPLVAAPILSSLLALAVLVDSYVERRNAAGVALAAAAIVMVVGRAVLTFRENIDINAHMQVLATSDALTGLGNRRKLIADLDEMFDTRDDTQRVFIIFDLNGFKGYNDTFGHPAGDALLARLAAKLEVGVGPNGTCYRLGGDEFCVLAPVETAELGSLLDRTTEALSEVGDGFGVSAALGCVIVPEEASLTEDALRIADQRLYAQKHQASIARGQPHAVLLQALEEREPELRRHVGGVADLALKIGTALGLPEALREELGLAAQLHDIGKLAIPDAILEKPGPLDEFEVEFIRSHTVIGQRIVAASPALREVALIVRATHERWDGGGYPDGLAGKDIPLAARIITVCDSFRAMTEDRPQARALTNEQALTELRRFAGTQFDPMLVDAFCALEPVSASPEWAS